MSKIFVTGIAGFLGSHLADRLIKEGHEVSGCDNLIGGYRENVPEKALCYIADCTDRERMHELLEGVDIVYHCACTAYEGLSVFSPDLISRNTYGATISVLSAAISRKVKRFVYLSSMARYGNQKAPFIETMECKPEDPYGISKYAAELAVRNLCDTHDIEWSIAVPHNIIGTRQKYDDPYRNVASIFINMVLQGKAPIIYGDGLQERCFSFVDDVVEPLVKMGFVPQANRQVINVGPDKGSVTISMLAGIIVGMAGAGKIEYDDIKFVPDRPREVKFATCSADKARRLLGYEPKKELREGLQEMVNDIKEKGTREFKYHLPLEITNLFTPKSWVEKMF